jgi:hypothetical protein
MKMMLILIQNIPQVQIEPNWLLSNLRDDYTYLELPMKKSHPLYL